MKKHDSLIKWFLYSGFLEGWSYLVLFCVAMPLKYWAKQPEYVKYVGMIHGVLAILFVILLWLMFTKVKLSSKSTITAFALSFVPFGTFFLKRLLRSEKLI